MKPSSQSDLFLENILSEKQSSEFTRQDNGRLKVSNDIFYSTIRIIAEKRTTLSKNKTTKVLRDRKTTT